MADARVKPAGEVEAAITVDDARLAAVASDAASSVASAVGNRAIGRAAAALGAGASSPAQRSLVARLGQAHGGNRAMARILARTQGDRGGPGGSGPQFEVEGGRVRLYRAMSPAETDSLIKFGDFNYAPSGGGKYFALNESDARAFAKAMYGSDQNATIVVTTVPKGFVAAPPLTPTTQAQPYIDRKGNASLQTGDVYLFFDPRGGGWSLHVDDEALPILNSQMTQPAILQSPAPVVGAPPSATPTPQAPPAGGSQAPGPPPVTASSQAAGAGPQGDRQSVPPPPAWITGPQPVRPTAPPAAVATGDPVTVGKLYSPNLVTEYRNQQMLYTYSSTALAALEAKEAKATELGVELSDEDKQAKVTLTAQVAAAQAKMLQARKDYEMLQSPASTPQQVQEMFARRGIAIPVGPQTDKSGAAALQGTGLSGWGLDDKGFTKKSGTATTRTVIGPDGNPVTTTDDTTSSTNVGFGTVKTVTGTKTTTVQGDSSTAVDQSTTKSLDLIKGEGSVSKQDTKASTDASGTTTTTTNKSTVTAGLGGITKTTDESKQVGSHVDAKGSSIGVVRGPGQLGVAAGTTTKSGTMIGPPGQEKMDKGTEQSNKLTGGLVSDDKGTGIGGTAGQDRKTMLGDGKTVGTTIAAGGRCQALVKEVPGSEPPMFTITTTISFDVSLGASAGKDWEAKPGAQRDTGLKAGVSGSIGASVGIYASFKRRLSDAEAKKYIDFVNANGRGSQLPEHMILSTGATQGWDAAKKLWQSMNGSPDLIKSMKPGEDVETNAEVGGSGKVGASGGQSGTGGLSIGGDVGAKAKHKINVHKLVMPDGKIMVTATIGDEAELSGSLTASMGYAGMKAGKSSTSGQGRSVVFILDPKDPAFDSQLVTIDAAATPEELDRLAVQFKTLLASKTDSKTEGEGDTVGANIGPVNIDLGGTAKVTADVTRDRDGNIISTKYTGTSTGGGTVGVGDVKVGDSRTDTFTGETDTDKEGKQHAIGKSEHSTTAFSAAKTWAAIKSAPKDPLHAIVAGPGSLVKSDLTSDKSMFYGQGDYDAVVAESHDEPTWMAHVASPSLRPLWRSTMNQIRAASAWVENPDTGRGRWTYDANKVQAALANWQAHSRGSDATDYVVRHAGSGEGGVVAAFPGATAPLEVDFKRYAVKDPVAESAAVRAYDSAVSAAFTSGNAADPGKLAALIQAAIDDMNDAKSHLDGLSSGLVGQAGQFPDPGVHGEMMGLITKRLTAVRNEVRALEDAKASSGAVAPAPSKPGAKVDKTAQAKAQAEADTAKANADADRAAKDAANAEAEARANFDQMWRYSASISGLLGQVNALNKERSPDFPTMNRSLDSASAQLKHWRELRTRNTDLVSRNHIGDWLNGPDPAASQASYESIWKAAHAGY